MTGHENAHADDPNSGDYAGLQDQRTHKSKRAAGHLLQRLFGKLAVLGLFLPKLQLFFGDLAVFHFDEQLADGEDILLAQLCALFLQRRLYLSDGLQLKQRLDKCFVGKCFLDSFCVHNMTSGFYQRRVAAR